MLRIAWFTTARGPGSRNLFLRVVEAIRSGSLDAEISVVFSNRSPGEAPATDSFFDLVREYGAPLVTLSSVSFRKEHGGKLSRPGEPLPEWRQDFDETVAGLLAPYDFQIGVLAGYMLITTDSLCERYPLLNLHPAAPNGPEGVWQDVIRQLVREGADSSGVQIQRATSNVDRGPLVSYCTYTIRGTGIDYLWAGHYPGTGDISEESPLFQEIRRRGMVREAPLMVETLRAVAAGRIDIALGQPPLDLTDAVERAVADGQPRSRRGAG
jgi:folate-dependent phosphoribosylglycinamide formyltransferase PurN